MIKTIRLQDTTQDLIRQVGGKTYEDSILILLAKYGIKPKEEEPKTMWVSASQNFKPLEFKPDEPKPKFKIADDGTITKIQPETK